MRVIFRGGSYRKIIFAVLLVIIIVTEIVLVIEADFEDRCCLEFFAKRQILKGIDLRTQLFCVTRLQQFQESLRASFGMAALTIDGDDAGRVKIVHVAVLDMMLRLASDETLSFNEQLDELADEGVVIWIEEWLVSVGAKLRVFVARGL